MGPSRKGLLGERVLVLSGKCRRDKQVNHTCSALGFLYLTSPGTSDPLFPASDLGEIHSRGSAFSCLHVFGPRRAWDPKLGPPLQLGLG